MSWVVVLIVGALVISAVLNGIVHLIFKVSGGGKNDID